MHSSPVPIGKRPEFKQSRSAGWSWPRLVPIHEQQSRSSQASQTSVLPSPPDHSEQEEPPTTIVSTKISKLPAEEDAPLSPVLSADGSPSTATGGSVAGTVADQPNDSPRNSLTSSLRGLDNNETRFALSISDSGPDSDSDSDSDSAKDIAERKDPGSERGAIEDVAKASASASDSARDIAEQKDPGSERGPIEDVAEKSASASDRGLIEDMAEQGHNEILEGHENTITDAPFEEETPATPPGAPIPPVMDRISGPSSSIPYYATPKIMVHKPSQSSEAENPASRTIDEILSSERQVLPQEKDAQPPHSTQDDNLIDPPPMQSMSLKPIAWQAPKDQKVRKRNLYLRKLRNAAARKMILKATLGRQLAVPTKQMLRLLANGENLTSLDLSKPRVEAATMLVPQEAVGSITGAVLLPQGVAGTVSDT